MALPVLNATKQQFTMSKKPFCVALCTLLLALCSSVDAQQQPRISKIGFLSRRVSDAVGRPRLERELRALGYVEGKNIAFEYRRFDNKLDRLPALADELVHLKVDVLFTPGINEALAAKNTTRTIPIVFSTTADPVAAGLVDSLARPGGNITGFTYIGAELSGKRLELLKEIISKLHRVAVLWNPDDPGSTQQWKESQLPARELGLQLHSMKVSSADKYESTFKEVIQTGNAALSVTQSALTNSHQKLLADVAAKNQLPAVYPRGDFAESGGLLSYGADQAEPFRRGAVLVDKILKGAKPADLPVEQPKKFELVINLKAAKQIGLTIPPNVLARADRVIK